MVIHKSVPPKKEKKEEKKGWKPNAKRLFVRKTLLACTLPQLLIIHIAAVVETHQQRAHVQISLTDVENTGELHIPTMWKQTALTRTFRQLDPSLPGSTDTLPARGARPAEQLWGSRGPGAASQPHQHTKLDVWGQSWNGEEEEDLRHVHAKLDQNKTFH